MQGPDPESCLQGVVVCIRNAVELVDMTEAGILRSELTVLIDVQHHRLLSSLAAHVSDLENGCAAQAFLDLQVVIKGVGIPEVLADAEYIERRIGAANTGWTGRNRWKYRHAGLPSEAVVKSVERDGRWTRG